MHKFEKSFLNCPIVNLFQVEEKIILLHCLMIKPIETVF
jgi:hypothetical protein